MRIHGKTVIPLQYTCTYWNALTVEGIKHILLYIQPTCLASLIANTQVHVAELTLLAQVLVDNTLSSFASLDAHLQDLYWHYMLA